MQKPNDYREQMGLVQRSMNEYEWTKELDSFLMQTVIRNYFNFQIVSIEVNNEAKTLGLDFGATNVFDGDKCRIRWTYLHLQRKLGQPLVYPNLQPRLYSSASENESDTNKENINDENVRQISSSTKRSKKTPRVISNKDPIQLLQEKDFQISQKKAPKTMEEIEANMWKNNIKPGMRKRNDFLDTSTEDFSMNKTKTIDGKEITPSSFNIFRDSLREASERLHETLNDNLPDMNLKEIEESESEAEMSGSDDEDVLPLDFRTALIEKDNKVVIQAKPLTMKTITDIENEDGLAASMRNAGHRSGPGLDTYLEMVRKEAFKEEEGAIMLDPDINIKEKFDQIDLPCNLENRINNAFNAPVRSEYISQIPSSSTQDGATSKKRGPRMKTTKTYDTDTDNQISEDEKFVSKKRAQKSDGISKSLKQAQQSETFKPDPLSFENSLKETGIDNLDDIISGQTSTAAKGPSQLSQIIKDNEAYQKKMEEEDALKGFTQKDMMDELDDLAGPPVEQTGPSKAIDSDVHHTEESDTAPVSPYADALTAEQEAKQKEEERKKQFLQAVQLVSSASETDEMSGTESVKAKKRLEKLEKQQSASGLTPVKESSSAKKKRKVKYYKGQVVMSDTEDDPKKVKQPQQVGEEKADEESSSSRSSNGSADDFFNSQRKAIRKKLNIPKKAGMVTSSPELPKNNAKEESEEEDEEDIAYQKRIEAERKLQQEMIQKKKEERMQQADELRRQEKLKKQQEMIDAQQEKKRKEKDELMNKLKKQDEERKKRKRIEKEQQEREKKRQQDIIAERKREEEERKKEEEDQKKRQMEEEKRQQRLVHDEQRRKDDFEENLLSEESWNQNGRTSIACLYDKKCAYMGRPNSIPLDLEHQIQNEQIPKEDLVFCRYKTMMIPLDSHINNQILSDLIKYFLLNSKIHQTFENDQKETEAMKNCFPYKLIGMQVTVTEAPLSKPPLKPYINTTSNYQKTDSQAKLEDGAIRVLSLIFDTQDEPKVVGNFTNILKTIKLSSILEHADICFMETNYKNFLQSLAKKYFRANQMKEFPFGVKNASAHMMEFENDADIQFMTSSANLGQIAFYTEYMRQDHVIPATTEESWEFFRRCPSFFAFNPNNLDHTKWDNTKKKSKSKVVAKKVQHKFENVCVVLKDINFVPVMACKAESSLDYLLTKACLKHGLDVCGLRLVYVDDKQHEEYQQLFHEKIELSSTWEKPMLALVFRGLDAAQKMEQILGHFNPEMARRTDEKSLRACFGKSRSDNCALQIFDQSKRLLSLKFWFGGRVQGEKFVINAAGIQPVKKENVVQLIAPTHEAKHILFLSPNLPVHKIPVILQRLSSMGVSVHDLQMIDYSKLQYHADSMSGFSREAFNNIRGRTFKFDVGYVIKVSRENFRSHYLSSRKYWERDLDGCLEEHSIDQLIFLTSTSDEYDKLNHLLKKDCLKTKYADLNQMSENDEVYKKYKKVRKSLDYDSEDPEEYKDIDLFTGLQAPKPTGGKPARKTNIKPLKSKTVDPVALEEKYQIGTCVCFIKISSFKKQVIGSTLHAILNQLDVELLGLRVMKGKKELYNEQVPKEVQKLLKCVAYKFHESSSEIKLRKKLLEFKTLALVLRGQDIQGQLSQIYDLEKLRFKADHSEGLEDMSFEDNPHVVFLTNKVTIAPIIDFMMETKYLNLFFDIKNRASHLGNSLTHFERLNQMIEQKDKAGVIDATSLIKIETKEDLLEPGELSDAKSCKAVCVVKPNQPFNVVLRALRSFANINPEGTKKKDYLPFVSISNLEIVQSYSQEQINHLYKHEFEFDESLSSRQKQKFKYTHDEMFQNRPVIQMVLEGHNALTKLKGLIGNQQYGGPSSSKLDVKDTLRSFYAIDRVDNAFYNSDTVEESIIDEKVLFSTETPIGKNEEWQIVSKDGKPLGGKVDTGAPVNLILQQNQVELALVVISPTLVANNDFVYVVDDFNRSKFGISALKMKSLSRESLEALFKDQCPRNHNLDVLESEFKRGDALLMVVEKVKAVEEAQNLVGKFGIKINSDWEKKKTHKKQGFQFMSYGGGAGNEESTLIHEYGSYIFCFPNVDLNKVKIVNEFRTLPASQNFKIERVK